MPAKKNFPDVYKWGKEEWTDHLAKSRGLTDFPEFTGSRYNKAREAAVYLAEKGIDDYTGLELTVVAEFPKIGEVVTKGLMSAVYSAVSGHYKAERYSAELAKLNMPALTLLKMETENYHGNLHRVLGYSVNTNGRVIKETGEPVYDIGVSNQDWLEGISIPLPDNVDFSCARLLGIIWGLGSMAGKTRKYPQLYLAGRRDNFELLVSHVNSLSKRVFRTEFLTYGTNEDNEEQRVQRVTFDGRVVDFKVMGLYKESAAISSFLRNEHRFPGPRQDTKERIRVPKDHMPGLISKEQIEGFVVGLKDFMIKQGSGSFFGRGRFGEELSRELNRHGYSHQYRPIRDSEAGWGIKFNVGPGYMFRQRVEALKRRSRSLGASSSQVANQMLARKILSDRVADEMRKYG